MLVPLVGGEPHVERHRAVGGSGRQQRVEVGRHLELGQERYDLAYLGLTAQRVGVLARAVHEQVIVHHAVDGHWHTVRIRARVRWLQPRRAVVGVATGPGFGFEVAVTLGARLERLAQVSPGMDTRLEVHHERLQPAVVKAVLVLKEPPVEVVLALEDLGSPRDEPLVPRVEAVVEIVLKQLATARGGDPAAKEN